MTKFDFEEFKNECLTGLVKKEVSIDERKLLLKNIPLELKNKNNWVCSDNRKLPYNPKSLWLAKPNEPNTWGSFDECIKQLGSKSKKDTEIINLGYMMSKFKGDSSCDNIIIIDIDLKEINKCNNEEKESALLITERLLERNKDTYIEKSVSGLGFHIVGYGHLPNTPLFSIDDIGKRAMNTGRKFKGVKKTLSSGEERILGKHIFEIYDRNRQMIFTGDAINNNPIRNIQSFIDKIWQHMGNEATKKSKSNNKEENVRIYRNTYSKNDLHNIPKLTEEMNKLGGELFQNISKKYKRKYSYKTFQELYQGDPRKFVNLDKSIEVLKFASSIKTFQCSFDDFLSLFLQSSLWKAYLIAADEGHPSRHNVGQWLENTWNTANVHKKSKKS